MNLVANNDRMVYIGVKNGEFVEVKPYYDEVDDTAEVEATTGGSVTGTTPDMKEMTKIFGGNTETDDEADNEANETSEDDEYAEVIGIKVAPEKAEFLDNFIITDVRGKLDYSFCNVLQSLYGSKLTKEVTTPSSSSGVTIEIDGILYNKRVRFVVCDFDDMDDEEALSTNWLAALNVILNALYVRTGKVSDSFKQYIGLPELVDRGGMYALDFELIEYTAKNQSIEAATKLYNGFPGIRKEITVKEMQEMLKAKEPTIKEYLEAVSLEDDEMLKIEVSRDFVVYEPEIIRVNKQIEE